MKKWTVTLQMSNLSEGIVDIGDKLKKNTKAPADHILLAELLAEETFLRLKSGMSGGEDFSVEVSPRSSWGDVELCMTAEGAEYNPLADIKEQALDNASDDEAINLAILRGNQRRLYYTRKGAANRVTIKVHEVGSTRKQLILTFGGLVLGVVIGLLMQFLMDKPTIAAVNGSFITPLRDMFLNALKMMMAPVTFFAILSGVTNISDTSLLGKLGSKMVVVSFFMQLLTAILGLSLAYILFSGDLSYMQAGITSTEVNTSVTQYPSLADLFFGIVPKNLVDPFRGENILQVIFLAIFFGIVLNKLGNKAKGIIHFVDIMFEFSITILKMIVEAIPLLVFLSMTALLANTGIESILAFGRLFGGLAIGVILVWIVGAITALLFARISPNKLTTKLIGLSPLVFTVSSSHARLPFVLKFCTEKLGIAPKLAAFSIPVGVQLNKAGNCTFFSLVTLMMMSIYGIEMTPSLFITLIVSVCVMAISKPPVPCGGIICLAYLFTVVGVPAEAISIIICIDPIAAMFNGVCNESANITTSFVLAKTSNMLDLKKYQG